MANDTLITVAANAIGEASKVCFTSDPKEQDILFASAVVPVILEAAAKAVENSPFEAPYADEAEWICCAARAIRKMT